MAYPDHLLSRGERVVLHRHPHWKVLVLPVLAFIVIIGGGFTLAAVVRHWQYHSIAWIVLAVVGVLLLVLLTVVPFLKWRSEHFVITNFHVFFRTGIVKRTEHQIPLRDVQNLETTRSFWGRLLGYGSLIVESAADQPLEFENVASLSKVQADLNQLIMDDRNPAQAAASPTPGAALPPTWNAGQQAGYEQSGFQPRQGYGSPPVNPTLVNPTQAYPTQGGPYPGQPEPRRR